MHQLLRSVFGRLAVQVALGSMLVILIVGVFLVGRLDQVLGENEGARVRADLTRARNRFDVQYGLYRDFALLSTVWVTSFEQVREAATAGDAEAAVASATDAYRRVAAALETRAPVTYFDLEGRVAAGQYPADAETPASVRHVLSTGTPVAGVELVPGMGPAIVAVAPVLALDERPAGVLQLVFAVDGRLVADYVTSLGMAVAFVVNGQALVTSLPDLAGTSIWPELGPEDSGTITDGGGETYLASSVPARGFDGSMVGTFYLVTPERVVAEGIDTARRELIVVTGGAIVLATLLTFGVAWVTTRPVQHLVAGARRIQANDLDRQVHVSGTGEIRSLGNAMEDMRLAIRQSRESLLRANRELASQVDLSTSNLADATNELVTVQQVLARLEEAPSGDFSGVASSLAGLEWVDGVVIALRSREGRLAVAASTRLAPGATVDLIDVVTLRLSEEPFAERWHVPVSLDEPIAARLASRRIGGFLVELMNTSDGVAGFVAVTAQQRLTLTSSRETLLRAVAREVALHIERRELEGVVEENRRISESVLREMSDGVLVLDQHGACRICNPAAARLLGHEQDEIIGRDVILYLGITHDTLDAMRAQTAQHPEMATAPVVIEQNGLRIAVTASRYPDAETGADGMILLLRDLTAEAEVERVRRDFVSIVGHELRTPLTLIRTSVDLLHEGDAGELNETQARLIQVLRNNSERMSRLINDLVDVASLAPGRLEIRPGWFDLSDAAAEVVETLRGEADARSHTLTLEVPDGVKVWADQNRIRQILTNLVSNAIKYTPEGGNIAVRVAEQDEHIEVAVSDDGIGVKPEEQTLLFERFYRAPGGRRMSNGAGLGLPIARALIDLHGGTIRVDSDGEHGSTFTFTLPRQPVGSE